MSTQQSERRHFGTTTITVSDDEFFTGYQVGNILYRTEWQGREITDVTIYTFVSSTAQSVYGTDRYRAGVLSGWFAALYNYHLPSSMSPPLVLSLPHAEERE